VTGSDRLDWKRQQEFYFSYGLLYSSFDICFAIRVLDIGVHFFKGSLPRPAKLLIFELISYRSTMELNVNSPLNKAFSFAGRNIKICIHTLRHLPNGLVQIIVTMTMYLSDRNTCPRDNFSNNKLQISGFRNACLFQKLSSFS